MSDMEDIVPFDIKNSLQSMQILEQEDVTVANKSALNKPTDKVASKSGATMEKEVDLEVGEMLNINFDKHFNEINNDNSSMGFVIEDNKVINEGMYNENKLSDL